MMSVDILPTALPLEASQHFSSALMPYLKVLIGKYRDEPGAPDTDDVESQRRALRRATVARDGILSAPHEWLEKPLSTWKASQKVTSASQHSAGTQLSSSEISSTMVGIRKKNVLLLGSGLVSKPTIDELCKRTDVQLIIGSSFDADMVLA